MNIRGRAVNKRVLIGVFSILLVSLVVTACGNTKEEQRAIDISIKAIENRDYENARDALSSVVEGDNKEVDKLWNVVYCYQGAGMELYANKKVNKAKEYLDNIDGSYTKYSTLKEDVEKIKEDIKEREDYIVEVDNLIKEVENIITNKEYEEYKEAEEKTSTDNIKFYWELSSEQRDKLDELNTKINNELFELRKIEDNKQLEVEEAELKSKDEKFTVEVAKELVEKNSNINTGGNRRYEVKSDAQYDKKRRKYYKVEIYIKDNNQLINNYVIYADGRYELLQTVEESSS